MGFLFPKKCCTRGQHGVFSNTKRVKYAVSAADYVVALIWYRTDDERMLGRKRNRSVYAVLRLANGKGRVDYVVFSFRSRNVVNM